jgi:acyl-CoA thioesterase-1
MVRKFWQALGWRICGILAVSLLLSMGASRADAADAVRIMMIGDSITAGYGLPATDALPARLQAALHNAGYAHVSILNKGISGDTTSGGLARLQWTLDDTPADAVIIALGANDVLRGLPPDFTEENLRAMLRVLQAEAKPVLLVGMLANPTLGPDFQAHFDAIYPKLAKEYGVLLYPFLLDGVVGDLALNQADGIHPNAQGVEIIAKKMMPYVISLVKQATETAKP